MPFTMIVGDIHCKQKLIFPILDRYLENYNINKIVFLGDYTDEWFVDNEMLLDSLDYHIKWCANHNNVEIVHLCGNHDYYYLDIPYRVNSCSGHNQEIQEEIRERLDKLNLKISTVVYNYLCTHAGITQHYYNRNFKTSDTAQDVCNKLNSMFNEYDVELERCSFVRGGRDRVSGPLWADRSETLPSDYNKCIQINQISAHTPSSTVYRVGFEDSHIFYCDTFSLNRYLSPLGDGSVLLVDEAIGSTKTIKPEDVGLPEYRQLVSDYFTSVKASVWNNLVNILNNGISSNTGK